MTERVTPQGETIETRYRCFFDNEAIMEVVSARTPNNADPVDEESILRFVQISDKAHAEHVRAVFAGNPNLS